MEIKTVSGNTAYIDGHQLIGLYLTDSRHCILLDSGVASAREEIEKTLLDAGLTPVGVLATHTHFDHFGNAAYFQQKYRIPVAISFGEAELCRTFPAVKGHLFVFSAGEIMSDPDMSAIPCKVDRVIMPAEDELYFCGVRFGILRTPGHSPEHISVITPDRVCYGGDALMCGHALTGVKLPYTYNFRQTLESIDLFRNLSCDWLLLAHRGVIPAPFDGIAEQNRAVMEQQLQTVAGIIDRQMSVEEIYAAVRESMGIRVDTPRKAQSLERFLRPYLECLIDDGTHRLSVRDGGTLCYEPA